MRSSHLYTVEGIVLKRHSVGEADRILTVFSRQLGKIRVIAKGVRKTTSRRAGHIEVFSRAVMTLYSGKGMDILSEASSITRGMLSDANATRIGYAYCMCELVDQLLADRQEHEDVYMLLSHGLDELLKQNNNEQWQVIVSQFVHHLLWKLGFLSSAKRLPHEEMRSYVEHITERKLRAWQPLSLS